MSATRTTVCSFLLILIFFPACDRVNDIQYLEEYKPSFESDIVERIYTYVRQPGGDTIVHKFVYADFVRNRYWQITKVNSVTTGERIYEVNNGRQKLIAEYEHQTLDEYSENREKIKGEILQYEEFDIGHRFKGLKCKIEFTNSDGFVRTLIEKDNSIKDTTEFWEGAEMKALQIDYTLIFKEKIKYFPFVVHTNEYQGSSIYLKDIGLLKWVIKSGDVESETKLVSIKTVARKKG